MSRGPFMLMVTWIEDGEPEAEPVIVAVSSDAVAFDLPGDIQMLIRRDELAALLTDELPKAEAA